MLVKEKLYPVKATKVFLFGQRNHQSKPYLYPQTPLLTWNPYAGLQ